ncbi:hypothetical protein Dalk_3635 [Desulfatibacillum aliphaticivorans]|uniref:Rod shape-determining protein MreD n=1 Tax=Desulfatibacillum aliphaticivorans TaxID=218208 RepID=B8FGU3_DESAL|nr:hypothetical protein [Desulfatibacillum aliphaticivorans]ACL05323.1 hypothetical protein Dalk_3635 [Desulfatibacillum aliphaticivorans]
MIYFLQIMMGLFIVVFQTTSPGQAVPLLSSYDMMVVFVLGLGLFRPLKEGVIIAVICGLAMDVYSGAPPWYYFVTYCWVYVAARWLPSFLHADNIIFMALFCGGGVLFQESFLHLCVFLLKSRPDVLIESLKQSGAAALSGAVTGPLIIWVHNTIVKRETKRQDRRERFV